jgi:hypothetical protein
LANSGIDVPVFASSTELTASSVIVINSGFVARKHALAGSVIVEEALVTIDAASKAGL